MKKLITKAIFIFNEMYKFYGDDVFNIGKAGNIGKRLKGYVAGYIAPVELIYSSILCKNYSVCEKEIHNRLNIFRVKTNREFFKAKIEIIIDVIEKTIDELNLLNDDELLKYHDDVKIKIKVKIKCGKNEHIEEKQQIINELILKIGLENITDIKKIITSEQLKNIISNSMAFTNFKRTKYLFNLNINKVDETNTKAILGFFNTILNNYNLKVKTYRISKQYKKITFYRLEPIILMSRDA
jgi:hypothetical protein